MLVRSSPSTAEKFYGHQVSVVALQHKSANQLSELDRGLLTLSAGSTTHTLNTAGAKASNGPSATQRGAELVVASSPALGQIGSGAGVQNPDRIITNFVLVVTVDLDSHAQRLMDASSSASPLMMTLQACLVSRRL